jgi:hypothetical protein
MMTSLLDDHAVYFEIPATDSLGREAVAGKLRATADQFFFLWRFKDRTFRKVSAEMTEIPIGFDQVEKMQLKTTLGLFKPRLIFQVTDAKLLADVPGIDVGQATLTLDKRGKADAKKMIKFIEFKKAEAVAEEARKRLNNLESGTL